MTQQFDLTRLKALLDTAPPRSRFVSWSLFSPAAAFSFKTDRTHWLVAHPGYWEKAMADPKVIVAAQASTLLGPSSIELEDVDDRDGDSEAIVKRKQAVRADLSHDLGLLFDQALAGSRAP